MRKILHIAFGLAFILSCKFPLQAQTSTSPAPYCSGNYSNGNCNQGGASNSPGNSVNDFINTFITSGGSDNISNVNSGCNNGPGNYMSYCQHYISVMPGQVITCTLQSGITFAQGFAIFIDWNQDNVFNLPSERVAATPGVPAAASFNVLTFTVPAGQPNGAYRLRVRCAFSTAGTAITPCGAFSFGETEDYTLYIGPIPPSSGVTTATATGNATLCTGQSASLNITTSAAGVTYTWTGPAGFTSTAQSPVINNVTTANAGIYTVVTSGGCPAVKNVTIAVAPSPEFTIAPSNPVICQGNTINASIMLSTPGLNPASFSFNWYPAGLVHGIYSPFSQTTTLGPGLITGVQAVLIYTAVVTPTLLSCPVTQTMALTINNPLTPTLNIPPTICNTANSITLSATPGGGTWTAPGTASPAVSAAGVLTPAAPMAIGINTLMYSTTVGTCVVSNTGTIQVSQFNTPALTSSVNLLCSGQDQPFNLMTIVQSTLGGSWSGVNVGANSFTPNLPTGVYTLTYNTVSTPNPTVCPASMVLNVPVFLPPIPVIATINPVCNNAGTIQLTATPTVGAVWQHPAVVALTGVFTPSLISNFGINTVVYTSGQGTCTASGSQTFHISEFRTAALSGSVPQLCVSNNPFNLLSITQNTNGTWGPAVAINNNIFNPAGLLTGTYAISYTNTSQPLNICQDISNIIVSVLNPEVPNITQVGPYCNVSGPVQLTVTPNTGVWTATSYLTQSGLFTPSLSPAGLNMVQYVIGTSTCNASQTKSISVEAYVPAVITSSISDQCNTNSPVNLLPVTSNNLGSWSGPGVLGASFNPAVAGTGTIVLTYNTSSSPSGLCPAQTTLAVNVFSLAVPFFNNTGPFCTSSRPVRLNVSPVGGFFGGANTHAVDASGLFNPAVALVGNNIVNYSITSGPCVAYAQTTVAVEQFVSADFISEAGPYCQNDERLQLNLNSLVLNPGGMWSGTAGVTGNIFTFAAANPDNNNIIHYRTDSKTYDLCPDTSKIRIRIIPVPTVIAKADVAQNCSPVKVNLYTPSFTSGEGSWNFGDGSEPEAGLKIDHTFINPGNYNVVFTYSVAAGINFNCSAYATLDNLITVYETPKADFNFSPNEIMISEPLVQFNNTSSILGNNRYIWKIEGPNYNKTLGEVNPSILFPQVGQYKVTLSATSLRGCKNDIVKTVDVKTEFSTYVPNSFTPNEDGLNDQFKPVFSEYGLDEKNYEMQIYDRWGVLLFSTKDRNTGWDGTIQNKGTQSLKQEAYVYKIKYKDVDGNIYSKMGQVTLIR